MTQNNKEQLNALNQERIAIETRLLIWGAMERGTNEYTDIDGVRKPLDAAAAALIAGHTIGADGERYVQIENQQWGDVTGDYSGGINESQPA